MTVEEIGIKLVRNRLCWVGQVCCLENDRPVKALLYGELADGTRKEGRPMLRYKETRKSLLREGRFLMTDVLWLTTAASGDS